jgi:hypothetical protein
VLTNARYLSETESTTTQRRALSQSTRFSR